MTSNSFLTPCNLKSCYKSYDKSFIKSFKSLNRKGGKLFAIAQVSVLVALVAYHFIKRINDI